MDAFTSLPTLPPEQRWRGQTTPAPVVVALIRRAFDDGERLLLIRRATDPYAGQWALVGGKWEFGETLAEAIVREVREETGLDAAFVAVRGLVSERVAPISSPAPAAPASNDALADIALGAHFLLLVCDLLVSEGEATEQREGLVAWLAHDAIDALHAAGAIIPSDYAMIREFAAAAAHAPYVEVQMLTRLGDRAAPQTEMVHFQRHDLSRDRYD